MTGQAHWIEPLLVVLGGVGVFAMVWLSARPSLYRERKRRLVCPATHEEVRLTVVESSLDGEPVDVTECSRFGANAPVPCKKTCVLAHAAAH